VFKLDATTGEPVLALDLGNVKACLPFPALIKAFEIVPGDSIPAELLDGSASWKGQAHHVATARGKLFAGLLDALGKLRDAYPRDRLHAETMRWDDLLALWNGGVSARAQRARIDEPARFVARHFPIASDWNAV